MVEKIKYVYGGSIMSKVVAMVEIGKIYRDGKGAGRLYIPKALMEHLNFANREKVLIKVVSSDKLVIEKFEEAVLGEVAAQ